MKTTTAMLHAALLMAATAAVSMAPAQAAPGRAGIAYGNLGDQWRAPGEVEDWYGALRRLRDGFDQICGDTFCEGDYSNIQALRFSCSAEPVSGRVGECAWAFAASQEEVDPHTGRIEVEAKHWSCRIPLRPGTRARALLTALAVEEPLHAPLPGSSNTIYDALIDCL